MTLYFEPIQLDELESPAPSNGYGNPEFVGSHTSLPRADLGAVAARYRLGPGAFVSLTAFGNANHVVMAVTLRIVDHVDFARHYHDEDRCGLIVR